MPALTFAWILTRVPDVLDGRPPTETVRWIPTLDVDIAMRLDALATVVSLLVTGVGALVLLYCARYFGPHAGSLGRFAGVLVAFAAAMLALVWSDDVIVLYVCWELTTVFSFLLVGHDAHKRASRAAAFQALVVTAAGGLTMLVGLVILAEAAGTYRLSELVAVFAGGGAATGTAVAGGVICVLVGALSKSALIPFHFWLPSAMAAPTPVSAYLHAAAMVKAGVYLVLRLAPGLADVDPWRLLVAVLAVATMLLGGVQALRQTDLKLVLAYGTVSQLGFMVLLAGAGTYDAALAASRPADHPRPVQGLPVPHRRGHRPPGRHPGPAGALRARAARAGARRGRGAGRVVDGGAAAAAGVRHQGGRLRGVPP